MGRKQVGLIVTSYAILVLSLGLDGKLPWWTAIFAIAAIFIALHRDLKQVRLKVKVGNQIFVYARTEEEEKA